MNSSDLYNGLLQKVEEQPPARPRLASTTVVGKRLPKRSSAVISDHQTLQDVLPRFPRPSLGVGLKLNN
jgi:hypothetical protein